MSKRLITQLLLRQDTSAHLTNIVPAQGEPIYCTDVPSLRIGDGVRTWANLPDINAPTDNCLVDVKQYSVLSASGTTPPSSTAQWVENAYLSGVKATPWIWTRYDYECQNGETIQLFYRTYDASWQQYDFVGTETTETITTQFPCAVNGNALVIGAIADPAGVVNTTGTFTYTPSGVIQLK